MTATEICIKWKYSKRGADTVLILAQTSGKTFGEVLRILITGGYLKKGWV